MSDRSYGKLRGEPPRTNADGEPVSMEQFAGRFVWADYAAPWCGPCSPQSKIISSLEQSEGQDVVFLTVMTSEMGGYGNPATVETAKAWASRHGLAPDRVVAATNLHSIKVPRHILFSPEGHMVFNKTGSMSGAEIRSVVKKRSTDWNAWAERGSLASWMRPG